MGSQVRVVTVIDWVGVVYAACVAAVVAAVGVGRWLSR